LPFEALWFQSKAKYLKPETYVGFKRRRQLARMPSPNLAPYSSAHSTRRTNDYEFAASRI